VTCVKSLRSSYMGTWGNIHGGRQHLGALDIVFGEELGRVSLVPLHHLPQELPLYLASHYSTQNDLFITRFPGLGRKPLPAPKALLYGSTHARHLRRHSAH